MKRYLLALSVLVLGSGTAFAADPVPEIPYDSVPDFLKLPAGRSSNSAGFTRWRALRKMSSMSLRS